VINDSRLRCVSIWVTVARCHPIAASTMPRSKKAQQWQPDAFEQDMIDRIANYIVVAERCAAHLRSFDFPNVEGLWAQVQADFQANTAKFPSVMAEHNDAKGRKQFQLRCQAICFPPKSNPPRSPEECVPRPFSPACPLSNLMPQLHQNDFCSTLRPPKP
jgi:hypothetical protein